MFMVNTVSLTKHTNLRYRPDDENAYNPPLPTLSAPENLCSVIENDSKERAITETQKKKELFSFILVARVLAFSFAFHPFFIE